MAAKKEDKAIEKAPEQALAGQEGLGTIGTISGIGPEDINMPYMYVVQANSKHAIKADGKRADMGTLFHGTKKKAYESIDVLLAFAKKGTARKTDFTTGEEREVEAFRSVMLPVDNVYSPFSFTFKEMGLWYGFKPYLSELVANGVTNMDHVVTISTKEVETNYGSVVYVPVLTPGDKTTKAQRESMQAALERFGGNLDEMMDEDANEGFDDLPTQEGEVDVDEIIKEDLDGKVDEN